MRPSGLILDFGEVLTRAQPRETVERMAGLAGMPVEELTGRYWRHRLAYDGGLTGEEYWRRVLEDEAGPEPPLAELIAADAESWMDYRTDVWDLAAEFRRRGGRTAMLSNGVAEIIARVRADRQLDRWFDAVVVSCEVGCCKPDPEIYRICLQRLGVAADRTLFVDDRRENLAAAERVGLQTLHFTGDESLPALRAVLRL